MHSKEEENLVIVRLFPGEDLFVSLKEVCRRHTVRTAVIVSAAGQLKMFRLGFFDGNEYRMKDVDETHELLSLTGLLTQADSPDDYQFHLHAMVGDQEKRAYGGHLFKGIIEGTGEIVLLKSGIKARRQPDANGLMGLVME